MQITITCKNCGHEVSANFRLKGNQQYCGAPKCQRLRKRAWQKAKITTDKKYRAQQSACLKRWRQRRPLNQYQKLYRDRHPEYVEKNREKQRLRNDKRQQRVQLTPSEKIVKMDAFQNQPIKSGLYWLTPSAMDASQKIVKMDALLVELKTFYDDSRLHVANTC
jgi:ribosomal protein L37E